MITADKLSLLPYPRKLDAADGQYVIKSGRRIVLTGAPMVALEATGRRLQDALAAYADADWDLAASELGPADQVGVVLRVSADGIAQEQGYSLRITPERIEVEAQTAAGVFYGVCTLAQIIMQCGRDLPALKIEDWPDFKARGVMLDISRDKVPRMETLYTLIEMLASWKMNEIQLYTEHTFAFRQHPDVWATASPVTGDEILALDAFCRERFIDLVPNQNSFGHMHRWLIHKRYADLAEIQGEFMTPWGVPLQGPFTLCPDDPGSLELMQGIYDELLPHFSSQQFNVGCDETFDLGQGRSKEDCEARGTERVYLDYLLKIHQEVSKRNRTMQFWGDIIVQKPELIDELPKDAIALEWGYEADHSFADHCPQFAASGIPFYVCPGTSAWNTIGGRTENALGNLLSAAENGLKHGAIGYLTTDWGDNGHWQTMPISFLGYGLGAAFSWALDANRDMDVAAVISLFAFGDPTGNMGKVAYDLGNVYKATDVSLHNSSALFWILQRNFHDEWFQLKDENPNFDAALAAVDAALAPLADAKLDRPDGVLIVEEFELAARMLRHACHRGTLMRDTAPDQAATKQTLDDDLRDIVLEYERIWLIRNRPGGLIDSVGRLVKGRADYR